MADRLAGGNTGVDAEVHPVERQLLPELATEIVGQGEHPYLLLDRQREEIRFVPSGYHQRGAGAERERICEPDRKRARGGHVSLGDSMAERAGVALHAVRLEAVPRQAWSGSGMIGAVKGTGTGGARVEAETGFAELLLEVIDSGRRTATYKLAVASWTCPPAVMLMLGPSGLARSPSDTYRRTSPPQYSTQSMPAFVRWALTGPRSSPTGIPSMRPLSEAKRRRCPFRQQ